MFDLNLRVQGLENGFEEVVCAILQIQQGIQDANKQSVYLAVLRLALSFIPVAGGALGTGVDLIRNALEAMDTAGAEVSNHCILPTVMMGAVYPLLSSGSGSVRTDLGELESLKERLVPQFLEALPEEPRNTFVNLVREYLTGGIGELRQELENLLKEAATNKDFLKSKVAEAVQYEKVAEGSQQPVSQKKQEFHSGGVVSQSEEPGQDTGRQQENRSLTKAARSCSRKAGNPHIEDQPLLQKAEQTESLIQALIRDSGLQISELERRALRAASTEDVPPTAKLVASKNLIDDVLSFLIM